MRIGSFDIYATTRDATSAPVDIHSRSYLSIQRGWSEGDWEITLGDWYLVVSRTQ